MFKILLLLNILFFLVSTLNIYESSINQKVSVDYHNQWPFVEQQFSKWKVQSPVNIESKDAYYINLSSLYYYRYWPADNNSVHIKIGNKKNSLHISSVDANKAHITGGPLFKKEYLFSHMHIYWNVEGKIGSAHLIDSQGYPMEIQMIHFKREYNHYKNATNYPDGICIISYFGKISDEDNPLMSDFIKAVQSLRNPGPTYIFSSFDIHFKWLLDVAKNYCYYVYPGSITTSPFSGCVIYIVYENPFNISQAQLNIFQTLLGEDGNNLTCINRRMIQSFNNRPLYYV